MSRRGYRCASPEFRPGIGPGAAGRFLAGLCILVGLAAAAPRASGVEGPATPSPDEGTVDFVRDVKPIFVAHCYECHGPGDERGGLSLARRSLALAGGDHGPGFVPGSAETSSLMRRITGNDAPAMPLDGEPLTAAEIDVLRRWIDQGAAWPASAEDPDPRHVKARTHWAFQPLRKPAVPGRAGGPATTTDPADTPEQAAAAIDAFVAARLADEGLALMPAADPVTLLRRATFDLTGLAPDPDEVASFAADSRPQAYPDLIERLLASPRHGERWARHWLDVVRYSDSGGYDTDIFYEQAWRYRNYCIRSFNDDKPFDRFLEEQVAGDELWPERAAELADAVAIWTLGQWPNAFDAFPDKLAAVRRNDQVTTLGEAMLGLTVGCANCHHHKYDPISQRDYFALEAVFAASETFNTKTGNVAWAQGETSHFRGLRHATPAVPIHLLRRGELSQPAGLVEPALPAFLPGGGGLFPDGVDRPAERRARLAKWITAADNPLTARVIANRVWQWHFGRGLVATPNDFGTQGEAPTHRELLDWLAADLRDHGWSLKRLHRSIMLSDTYRQRTAREAPDAEERLARAWLLAFARPIREDERVVARAFLAGRPGGRTTGRVPGP